MARYEMVSLVLLCKSEIAQVKSSILNRYQVLVWTLLLSDFSLQFF